MAKTKFVSKVQDGREWQKENHAKWNKIIDQIGTIIEDEVHKGKNNTTATLKAGSKVIIDDIRGRVLPQYRVKDQDGKIWFVTATNVEFDFDTIIRSEENPLNTEYRGGIRVDNTDLKRGKERYERPALSTEDVLRLKKEKQNA